MPSLLQRFCELWLCLQGWDPGQQPPFSSCPAVKAAPPPAAAQGIFHIFFHLIALYCGEGSPFVIVLPDLKIATTTSLAQLDQSSRSTDRFQLLGAVSLPDY
ncbi:hypothetical protein UY3_06006 [Chelonia mydas]|uniref:Uncharacterized protein n=1 Tax=Chelonia mydas TaxID=8469 RepID=M7BM50_CHEMY|nr:hypothetical protein UY3_06006 [Chelonia mydas]